MTTLRGIHELMTARRLVVLADGRKGKVVRVDTVFPANDTTVTLWTNTAAGPRVAKVPLDQVLGAASDAR
ncbi:MAG: hypothetical protein DIU78_015395 [Pseudomonadota bacterium]